MGIFENSTMMLDNNILDYVFSLVNSFGSIN